VFFSSTIGYIKPFQGFTTLGEAVPPVSPVVIHIKPLSRFRAGEA